MAVNLVTAGIDVVGFNRSPWNADRFVELGGRRAMFVSEAVAGADAVITMRIMLDVAPAPDVQSVYTGGMGCFPHQRLEPCSST